MSQFRKLLLAHCLFAPSDSVAGGATNQTNQTESIINKVLGDAAEAAQLATLTGNPIAIGAAAGTTLATTIAGDIEGAQASHASAVQTTDTVLGDLSTKSAPLIAALPTEDQAKANAALSLIGEAWAAFKSFW